MERTPLLRRRFPFASYNATLILVAINVGVFFLTLTFGTVIRYLAMIPAFVVVYNWWWQVVTYMFVHSNTSHILWNMLFLFVFGSALENRIGSHEFLLFYLVSGTLAGLFSLLVYWLTGQYLVTLLGASGAVYAVMFAAAAYFPRASVRVYFLIPVPLPILALVKLGTDVFGVLIGNTGVAHLTHIAGAVFAFLYLIVRMQMKPVREIIDAWR